MPAPVLDHLLILERPGGFLDPALGLVYTSNGEVRQEFSIVFTARPIRGQLRRSSESAEPQWVSRDVVSGLRMHPPMRQRIQYHPGQRPQPHLG